MERIKVAVFDDEPRYVEALCRLLERDGFEALGIVVDIRSTPEAVARKVVAFGPQVLVADRACWDDERFGVRVIELCAGIPNLRILSSSGRPQVEMSRVVHGEFRKKDELVSGCETQTKLFFTVLRRLLDQQFATSPAPVS